MSEPERALERHIGYWMRFVSNHVSQAFMRKVESKGVTVAEWVLMQELQQTGPVSPSDLAERLGMTRGAISKLVERLRSKELAERRVSADDRRYQTVVLTARGRKLVPVLARLADDNDREFFGDLAPSQTAMLLSLLQGLVRRHGWNDVPVS